MTRPNKPRHRSGGNILGPEFRNVSVEGLEVRDGAPGTDSIVLTGSPIVYNTPYNVRDYMGEFSETMKPGVMTDIIDTCDCRFLLNHTGMPMARTQSGTLTLADTPSALTYVANLSARQQLANDLAEAVTRGDISQMSCGFIVARDEWLDNETRDVYAFEALLDISAVTYPASPTTTIDVAQRAMMEMVFEIPIASRARFAKTISLSADLRKGAAISSANAALLANLLDAHQQAEANLANGKASLLALAKTAGLNTGDGENAKPVPGEGGPQGDSSSGLAPGGSQDASGSYDISGREWHGPSLMTPRSDES